MRLGIIGLPQSGKTTIFNALTRGDTPVTMSGGRFEVHSALVDVPDWRIERLTALFHPHKTTYAQVMYADIAGLEGKGGSNGEPQDKHGKHGANGFSGPLLNQLNQMDGFVHVVRCFENASVPHILGEVDPLRDIEAVDGELLLLDLITVERKLDRLAEELRKGGAKDRAPLAQERALFEKLKAALSAEIPLRDLELTVEEEKRLAGYGFLTRKPVLLLLNLADGQKALEIAYDHQRSALLALQGKLEMELAQMPLDEAEMFMGEFGVQELGLQRVIASSYDLLGLLSFFTVGEDEVRAWTVRRGVSAVDAAGAIHTDLQKGFIRAEVVTVADLLDLGGLAAARAQGRLRLEGRDYRVRDGEIMHIRFNI